MKEIKPNYYENFICIADQCNHNCCIGWEIDIDPETLDLYQKLPGELGARLRATISMEETPHFILAEHDRCPFLNQQNLCEIISQIGEESLCNICADHPRFRNFFTDRVEIGLGLCCEAAGRLILNQKEPMRLIESGTENLTDEEYALLAFRDKIIGILQDRTQSMRERIETVLSSIGCSLPNKDWYPVFFALERLDPVWEDYLLRLRLPPSPLSPEWEIPFEQLAVYFIYRHLSAGPEDGRIKERVLFVMLSTAIVQQIFATDPIHSMDQLIEIARLYSAEIEYSDENIDRLLNEFT